MRDCLQLIEINVNEIRCMMRDQTKFLYYFIMSINRYLNDIFQINSYRSLLTLLPFLDVLSLNSSSESEIIVYNFNFESIYRCIYHRTIKSNLQYFYNKDGVGLPGDARVTAAPLNYFKV